MRPTALSLESDDTKKVLEADVAKAAPHMGAMQEIAKNRGALRRGLLAALGLAALLSSTDCRKSCTNPDDDFGDQAVA